jgi:hypothetical protein
MGVMVANVALEAITRRIAALALTDMSGWLARCK